MNYELETLALLKYHYSYPRTVVTNSIYPVDFLQFENEFTFRKKKNEHFDIFYFKGEGKCFRLISAVN